MTTQSLPISKTRKDITVSVLISILIVASAALIVYYARPGGLIMRQPRMTFVFAYSLIIGFTAFTFLKRPPLGYISRVLAWSSNIVFAIGMVGFYFFTDDKSKHWGFKGLLLSEAMIFYRKKMSYKSRSNILHQLIFALVCALFIGTVGYVYLDKAISGGALLEYRTPATPVNNVPVPSDPNTDPALNPGLDPSQSTNSSIEPLITSIPIDTTPVS